MCVQPRSANLNYNHNRKDEVNDEIASLSCLLLLDLWSTHAVNDSLRVLVLPVEGDRAQVSVHASKSATGEGGETS